MRSRWVYGLAGVVAVVVLAGVLLWANEPEVVPLAPVPTGELTVAGQVVLVPGAPGRRQPVTARVTISADRAVTVHGLVVKVRDDSGTFHDFPVLPDVQLTTTPRQLVTSRTFDVRGDYTYYLAYQLDADWVGLPPWHRFTVS